MKMVESYLIRFLDCGYIIIKFFAEGQIVRYAIRIRISILLFCQDKIKEICLYY